MRVSFITWMLIGGTVAVVLLIALFGLLLVVSRPEVRSVQGQQAEAREAARRLGVMTRDQRLVAVVFGLTIVLWLLPAILELLPGLVPVAADTYRRHLPESIVALLGASSLFVMRGASGEPLMDWRQAATIDWGTVLLLGGGAMLGRLAIETELAPAIGRAILQMPMKQTTILVVLGGVLLAVIFSEVASNTAAVNLIVPVLLGVGVAGDLSVTSPAVAATLGASLGFMLPVATPPNAMVYASGLAPRRRMFQLGLMLDLVGMLAIMLVVLVLGTWILPTA